MSANYIISIERIRPKWIIADKHGIGWVAPIMGRTYEARAKKSIYKLGSGRDGSDQLANEWGQANEKRVVWTIRLPFGFRPSPSDASGTARRRSVQRIRRTVSQGDAGVTVMGDDT